MANEEQLSILKQGVDVWNKWREDHPDVELDLNLADLEGANLSEANLTGANLRAANLIQANLSRVNLVGANIREANLSGADLSEANLSEADLTGANLWQTDLQRAELSGAYLVGSYLNRANISETKFSSAYIGLANFGNVDLRDAVGLDEVNLSGPSTIGTDTLVLSQGKIPEGFLRGVGLSDADIEYAKLSNPELSNEEINRILYKMYDLRATQAVQISPLFISYSHADGSFVDKVESELNARGIRFWRDIHQMKSGRIEKQIDRAIQQNSTVLLVLSEHSLSSDWVEHEVRTARDLEKGLGRDTLCPIALDDSWKFSLWPKRIMEQIMEYNILDFSDWQDNAKFDGMFRKLIDGLELFYKG